MKFMKVTLDLDPRRVWAIEEVAEAQGLSLSDVVNKLIALPAPRRKGKQSPEVREVTRRRVAELQAAGFSDVQIGHAIDRVPAHVGRVRRELGLVANKGKVTV